MKVNQVKSVLILIVLFAIQSAAAKQITGYVKVKGSNIALPEVLVQIKGLSTQTKTGKNGYYEIQAENGQTLVFSIVGFESLEKVVDKGNRIDAALEPAQIVSANDLLMDQHTLTAHNTTQYTPTMQKEAMVRVGGVHVRPMYRSATFNQSESYKKVNENTFLRAVQEPLSTFAADVDAASYSNVRRFINQGQLPPVDAVRVEEMINYFSYDLSAPTNGDPVRVVTEVTQAPWNTKHQLLRVSLKAKDISSAKLPAANFVFLIDVSGSMGSPNKLPLVKSSYKMLVDQLREQDRVAIVTYAGAAGVAMESTSGKEKRKIKDAIDALQASGATAGGAGLLKAYQIARANLVKGGNNRIIMATDGDFNVGASTDEDMETLIAKERNGGVFISILGYGMGNYKDSKLEALANKGHGNYAYIDNISEARKAIITEFGASLFTVAKDVKIQVEFNPYFVQSYRLVGYEHNLLEAADFNNDEKLGGDMGVGHTVTALYEIIPQGVKSNFDGSVDGLKYQEDIRPKTTTNKQELATVKFRYKEPDGDVSKLTSHVVNPKIIPLANASNDLRFATAVAELGMLIRNSDYKQQADFDQLIARAKDSQGKDEEGYRAEFVRLAQDAQALWRADQ
ncbi:von Willebrand factor type A domain-containing protein [Sphingobacterium sp. lm-10]|uniref:YfbK domain-containing protein n=1 Tax=Sphingobacterium sp. lm-10 TaxID=2944904 RepID=UPI0020228223|nr:von Willebrand factor type A domain-containing protein [Sphingobacterium sp. lm-10]MCL7987936.1 von Willebrand factor type A domain-containing protein [Sphingobacterium sp. lm-10]